MTSKKGKIILAILIFDLTSACFVTNYIDHWGNQRPNNVTAEVPNNPQEDALSTSEGAFMEEMQSTQDAFGNISAEDIQATVNSTLGMDEEMIRTEYYLPEDAIYITQIGAMINFQVMRPMDEIIDYYRTQLTAEKMQERKTGTEITDITANMIFSGHSSGKTMLIQMVSLNNGQTNVSIRLEDE